MKVLDKTMFLTMWWCCGGVLSSLFCEEFSELLTSPVWKQEVLTALLSNQHMIKEVTQGENLETLTMLGFWKDINTAWLECWNKIFRTELEIGVLSMEKERDV